MAMHSTPNHVLVPSTMPSPNLDKRKLVASIEYLFHVDTLMPPEATSPALHLSFRGQLCGDDCYALGKYYK
jgi:hypothetical protein